MHRPRFKSCYRCEIVPSVGVFLLSEVGQFMLQGPTYVQLAPLLDGRHSVDELVLLLDGKVSAPEVFYALELLKRKGYITDASVSLAPEQATFWELLGVDPELAARKLAETTVSVTAIGDLDPAPLRTKLEELGIHVVREDGLRQIVLTDDYARQELSDLNAAAIEQKRPWMLIRPVGLEAWIGPIFVPHKTGCWTCFEHRHAGHRKLERYLCRHNGLKGSFVIPRAAMPSSVHAALGLAATETAKWIAQESDATLEGKLLSIHAGTLQTQTHVLTRRPQCSACGDPAIVSKSQLRPIELSPTKASFVADGGHRAARPEETLSRLEHHVSPVTGVVARLTPIGADDRQLTLAYVADHNFAHSHDELFFMRKGQRSRSGGKGKTEAQAKMSALGEAIERYSGLFQGNEAKVRARLGDLNGAAIHPNEIMQYSERQLRSPGIASPGSWYNRVPEPFDASQEIEWSPLWPLLGGPVRYAPTALCYYRYGQGPVPFGRADSNGCAAGTGMAEAIYQGLLELVERDCTALWWYNRLHRPGVDLASFEEPYLDEIEAYYRSIGRKVWALDLTNDLGIPSIVAVSCCTDRAPANIVFGFGAHLDARIALLRAVTEMNQFLPAVLPLSPGDKEPYSITDPLLLHWFKTATLESEPYLAPDPSARARTLADYPAQSTQDLHGDLLRVARMLRDRGLETLVLDQTRPDTGLHVARVVVPGLRHFWARFAPGRLYDVPVAMGWLSKPTPEEALNPIPMFI